jgi:ABC-type dipeptide/oligopeptide/nickel transport system permease component
MMADGTVPSNPNPEMLVLVGTIVRTVVGVAGGFGMAWAKGVTGDQITQIVSALAILVPLIWGPLQKVMAARREHQIAVMSAKGGKAVQPASVAP